MYYCSYNLSQNKFRKPNSLPIIFNELSVVMQTTSLTGRILKTRKYQHRLLLFLKLLNELSLH